MSNDYFQFKEFTVRQGKAAMKVTTDSCVFGAWCAAEIQATVGYEPTKRLLDIGTGTALLSLMCAQKNNVLIDAIELEPFSAIQAAENVSASPYAERIKTAEGDILNFKPGGYPYIVCNPPFYENELESPHETRNIAHHSQYLRWDELFPLIAQKLDHSGMAFLLLPDSRTVYANDLFEQQQLFIHKQVWLSHSEGRSPFRRMVMLSNAPKETRIENMFIREANGAYSADFSCLLRDYYLHL